MLEIFYWILTAAWGIGLIVGYRFRPPGPFWESVGDVLALAFWIIIGLVIFHRA
jgi:hypothetical protein